MHETSKFDCEIVCDQGSMQFGRKTMHVSWVRVDIMNKKKIGKGREREILGKIYRKAEEAENERVWKKVAAGE